MSRSSGTRGEFFTSIIDDQDQYPALLTTFFDQFSILYNVIGEYNDITVSKDTNSMSFAIHAPSQDVADGIERRIQGDPVMVYNHQFSLHVARTGPTDLIIDIL